MNLIEAVQSVFSKYFQFSGRARRSEYWYWVLFTFLAGIVFGILDGLIFGWETEDPGVLGGVFSLATFIPGLSVSWRRLHDTNRSGWWLGGFYLALIPLIAIFVGVVLGLTATGGTEGNVPLMVLVGVFALALLAYSIVMLVFFAQDSQPGDNQFGPNPKDEGNFAVFD